MRLRTATTGALLCAAAATAALTLAPPALPETPAEGVYVARCSKQNRAAAFVGTMRAIDDSDRMSMRFTLLERILPGLDFQPLSLPGLTQWHRSRPGVQRFAFRQRVRALAEAAIYKVDVEFRWYDADGHLLREAVKRSRRCRQPGALPNLRVHRIGRRSNGQYFVRVLNRGRDVATGAAVQLFIDGDDAGTVMLPDIAPELIRGVTFTGPDCQGSVQAVVDPAASVRESFEDDNALTVPCAELG